MIRNREKIIISKPVDFPFQSEDQELCYDSVIKYFHNGFQRGEVSLVSPNNPLNGMAGQETSRRITKIISHKIRVFKHELYEVGDIVLWLDAKTVRMLRVHSVMQDKKSRRHFNLYCVEKRIDEPVNQTEVKSTFGSQLSSTPIAY